jgi:hypothetical protein
VKKERKLFDMKSRRSSHEQDHRFFGDSRFPGS